MYRSRESVGVSVHGSESKVVMGSVKLILRILLVVMKADISPLESNLETCIKMHISFNSITPVF